MQGLSPGVLLHEEELYCAASRNPREQALRSEEHQEIPGGGREWPWSEAVA